MDDPMLYWGLGLIAVAFLLVVVEVFVPSGGIISVCAFLVAVAGVVCLFLYETVWGVIGILGVLVLAPSTFFFALNLLPQTPTGKALLGDTGEQAASQAEDYRRQREALLALVGQEGVAITDLRPVGTVRIAGKRYDAIADRGVIASGVPVRVTAAEGMNQIKVREIPRDSAQS